MLSGGKTSPDRGALLNDASVRLRRFHGQLKPALQPRVRELLRHEHDRDQGERFRSGLEHRLWLEHHFDAAVFLVAERLE